MIHINNKIKNTVNSDKWRNCFHIQPPTGLLNDPNGLIYHNGTYHIFYQWHPDAPCHGLKYWNHVTSIDLVHWKQDDRILKPDSIYDSHGAYSGSAFVVNNEIQLFYTGNTRDEADKRIPYQLQATLNQERIDHKRVLIDSIPEGYTDHFRDPKVFSIHGGYAMIIGAQRLDHTGTAVIYTSPDLENWTFESELFTNLIDHSYMWECPDVFALDGKDFLLFCPQGSLNKPEKETNVYPNTYLSGDLDIQKWELKNHASMRLLDYGFDFYAAQTFLDEHNRRVMIAWIGAADGDYPTERYQWAHVLTIPRVLTQKHGYLYQTPHPQLKMLRKSCVDISTMLSRYELIVTNITDDFDIELYTNNNETLKLTFDSKTRILKLDRSSFTHKVSLDRGEVRSIKMEDALNNLQVFRDTSTVEIFINNGKYTMTARFFPKDISGKVRINTLDDNLHVDYYELEDVNHDI